MTLYVEDFEPFHSAVHGRDPFPWQSRLLRQIVAERRWPRLLDLPTGTGKTTCLDIALFALALDAHSGERRWCPRRIAMVVDRRIIVDHVAERGRKLQRALSANRVTGVVAVVAAALRSLSREADEPLAVFTLRGGMPKDDGWARTPDQPLILASTVDQLGSRLLLQGYGISEGMRPVHAGLIANDLLLLLDDVHLSQPFVETLDALALLREKFKPTSRLDPRFCYAFLSATHAASQSLPFRLTDEEKRIESMLGPRLHASKRAKIVECSGRTAVERVCVDEACRLSRRHRVMAIVVNRVASASTVARQLCEILGAEVDVALLTGRMRPLDRDDALRQLRERVITGRDRGDNDRRLIVVGTQCIEAGADFDFDALVSEGASLDALRQRFGRLDRLGVYGAAEGVVVFDKTAKDDSLYGEALGQTLRWLKVKMVKRAVDFGVLALPLPSGDELGQVLAPKPHAPVLLPAYLDLWMQTSPAPAIVPDVALWLHGPQSGPADVQVIWRADLTEADLDIDQSGDGLAARIVGSVRPSSLEAMSLPFVAARRWLGREDASDIFDVEGVHEDEEDDGYGGRALRWRGDDSGVIDARMLRPGDTIIVPSSRGGVRNGSFDPGGAEPVRDLAERAALFGRGQPMLRLHGALLAQHGLALPLDDLDDVREALGSLSADVPAGDWRRLWLERLAQSDQSFLVDAPEPWIVLQGRHVPARQLATRLTAADTIEGGVELTTDEDDSMHAGRTVTLAEHSGDVERFARLYAQAADLPPALVEDLALAGWLHDIGKADRRFQVLLRGGSEIEYFKDETPWAKSAMPSGAKAAHRVAALRSGYPRGGRHEVQSLAMIMTSAPALESKASNFDLVLHLVASHHGYCRPLAPVTMDPAPVEVSLPEHVHPSGWRASFPVTDSNHGLHRLDSRLADRFWQLCRKFGWLELCWLEAILRLADHRASETEQMSGDGM